MRFGSLQYVDLCIFGCEGVDMRIGSIKTAPTEFNG